MQIREKSVEKFNAILGLTFMEICIKYQRFYI